MRKLFVFLVFGALLLTGDVGLRTASFGGQAARIHPAMADLPAGASELPRYASVNWSAPDRPLFSIARSGTGGFNQEGTFSHDFFETIESQSVWGFDYATDGFLQLEQGELEHLMPVERAVLFFDHKWRSAII